MARNEITITIPSQLADLNSYVEACRTHWAAGSTMVKKNKEIVELAAIPYQIKAQSLNKPLHFIFNWYCENRRKDKDNIAFAKKFVFDGFQAAGIIENDGWDEIGNWIDILQVDKDNPRVEVIISNKPIHMAYRKITLRDMEEHPELEEAGFKKFDLIHRDKFKSIIEEGSDEAEKEEEAGTDWSEYTVAELKDELRDRDLKVSGNKDELISRLENKA